MLHDRLRRTSVIESIRFAFKAIVEIEVPPASPGEKARQEIRGEEKYTPALALPDVNVFVVASVFKAVAILPQ